MEEYQQSAKYYDAVLSPFIRTIRRRVLQLIKKYRYRSILDVCCGTGDQLKLLKQHGFEAEGIDLSDAMLEVAGRGTVKPKGQVMPMLLIPLNNPLYRCLVQS
jgi:demethylmenaquinone methyltransferase/2-methoxy-6-polyprenyl-1,4-benzoquinol methylase